MANIQNELNNIKNALFGQEVRGSIHDGIDAINKEVESITGKQVDLESTFDQLVINAGNSNAEIVDARVKADGTSYAKLGDRLDSVDSQLEHIENKPYEFLNLLNSGAVTKIKLIGDSITEGSSATGHITPTSGRVIYQATMDKDGDTKTYYENSDNSKCFANLFKNFINKNYPSIDVKNWGIGGKSAKWVFNRMSSLIDDDEDILIIQLGTNDRWDSGSKNAFYNYMEKIVEYSQTRSKLIVLMCANPTKNEFELNGSLKAGFAFSMAEVNEQLTKLSANKKLLFIDNYKYILNYLNTSRTQFSDVVEVEGSHPYDIGHKLIWENMKNTLKITDGTLKWLNSNVLANGCATLDDDFLLFSDTPTNKEKFPNLNQIYRCSITSKNTTISSFPTAPTGNLGGQLLTFLGANHLLHYQKFIPRQSDIEYIRYYNNTTSTWTEFKINSNMQVATVSDYRTGNNVITDFNVGKSIYVVRANAGNGCPSEQGGVLETTRPRVDALTFAYQEFHVYGKVDTYKRWWNGSAWDEWILM